MKWPKDFINKVIQGDALEIMKKIPSESVDMVMTSPPYYYLRDYQVKGQIGLEKHPNEYINKLVVIFRELKRILKKTGAFYLNLGDVYYGSGSTGHDYDRMSDYNRKLSSKIKERSNWLQPKQLMLMPARIAIALQEDGWILRNDIIYHKRNPMPSSVKDRLSNTYEHIYFYVKSRKYYYNLDSIREPHTSIKDLGRKRLDTKTPKHDLALKQKAGKIGPSGYLVQHPLGKNPGDVVKMARVKSNLQHFRRKGSGGHYDYGRIDSSKGRHKHILGKNHGNVVKVESRSKTKGLKKIMSMRNPPEPEEPNAFHESGKNPGDVVQKSVTDFQELIKEVYNRLDRNAVTYKGKNRLSNKNARVIRIFDGKKIRDTARKILKERKIPYSAGLIEYIHDHFSHPLGKNPGDFWTITTKPFLGAHFAVYPEKICVTPIKASCPEFVCKKCGKPRVKKIDSESIPTRPGNMSKDTDGVFAASRKRFMPVYKGEYYETCDCNAGFDPGIVLDLFVGSGTTCIMAERLNRRWIGIDISVEYCKMAIERIKTGKQKNK